MIRIVIVDDHPVVRRGIRNIVESATEMKVVGEAASADDLWATPLATCDAVILDLGIPGAVGTSVLRELKARHPGLPVLVLSIVPEEQCALRALRDGASGYITKRGAPDELVDAIRCVVSGQTYASPGVYRSTVHTGAPKLSGREVDVLRLFASGMSLTSIAARLDVSIKTVSTYRKRMLQKLQLDSSAALIRYAIDEQLVEQ